MSVVKIVNLSGIPVITEFECKRVKNINVRVRNDGSLYCSYPKHVSQSRAQSFVETSAGQLLRAIDAANRRRVESLGAAGLQDSMQVKVFGRYMPIIIEENSCTGCSSGSGSVVVRVSDRNDFAAVCKACADFDVVLFFYEGGGAPLREVLHPGQYKRVAIVTGSEGGFSVEEAEAAKAAGAVTVGLGPRILRCETAPLAALTSVMLLTGNLE